MTQILSREEAERAVCIDFEGLKSENDEPVAPWVLGVLLPKRLNSDWKIRHFVF